MADRKAKSANVTGTDVMPDHNWKGNPEAEGGIEEASSSKTSSQAPNDLAQSASKPQDPKRKDTVNVTFGDLSFTISADGSKHEVDDLTSKANKFKDSKITSENDLREALVKVYRIFLLGCSDKEYEEAIEGIVKNHFKNFSLSNTKNSSSGKGNFFGKIIQAVLLSDENGVLPPNASQTANTYSMALHNLLRNKIHPDSAAEELKKGIRFLRDAEIKNRNRSNVKQSEASDALSKAHNYVITKSAPADAESMIDLHNGVGLFVCRIDTLSGNPELVPIEQVTDNSDLLHEALIRKLRHDTLADAGLLPLFTALDVAKRAFGSLDEFTTHIICKENGHRIHIAKASDDDDNRYLKCEAEKAFHKLRSGQTYAIDGENIQGLVDFLSANPDAIDWEIGLSNKSAEGNSDDIGHVLRTSHADPAYEVTILSPENVAASALLHGFNKLTPDAKISIPPDQWHSLETWRRKRLKTNKKGLVNISNAKTAATETTDAMPKLFKVTVSGTTFTLDTSADTDIDIEENSTFCIDHAETKRNLSDEALIKSANLSYLIKLPLMTRGRNLTWEFTEAGVIATAQSPDTTYKLYLPYSLPKKGDPPLPTEKKSRGRPKKTATEDKSGGGGKKAS